MRFVYLCSDFMPQLTQWGHVVCRVTAKQLVESAVRARNFNRFAQFQTSVLRLKPFGELFFPEYLKNLFLQTIKIK